MRELPILFSAPMVRAILEGRKQMTRRICKPAEKAALSFAVDCDDGKWSDEEGNVLFRCPYGQPGDRLWVRETVRVIEHVSVGKVHLRYEADGANRVAEFPPRLKPVAVGKCIPNGCHREGARIFLQVTSVRAERLQDISEDDCWDEGIESWLEIDKNLPRYSDGTPAKYNSPKQAFKAMWDQLSGTGSWDANPWVWVIEFKREEAPA